jgi:hypothetical protein
LFNLVTVPLRLRHRLAGVVLCLAVSLLTGGLAAATTGVQPLSKAPIFLVSRADAKPFLGRFKLTAHGPGLISGSLVTAYNAAGYLEGSMAIYGYNSAGQEISWVASTYEYHYLEGIMRMDIWSPDGSLLLGHVHLGRGPDRRLTGQLVFGDTPESVTFSSVRTGQSIYSTGYGTLSTRPADAGSAAATTTVGIFSLALEDAQNLLARRTG